MNFSWHRRLNRLENDASQVTDFIWDMQYLLIQSVKEIWTI